jgi:hypothetical protein
MKKLYISVTMEDGTEYKATTRSADYVAYEAEARKKSWGGLSDSPSTWEAYVAYRALIRTRQLSLPFDVFIEQVDDITADPTETEPLGKALTADSS